MPNRRPYPTDVSEEEEEEEEEEEWAFVAPYLALLVSAKTRPSAPTTCARSSMPCGGS
jgi:hypothetical protein